MQDVMASTPAPDDRGRRSSRTGGGLRRGRGQAKSTVDLHLLAAAYAIDALDDAQREAFAAHLPECAACQETLAIAPGPLAALAIATVPRVAAPPTLSAMLRAVVTEVLPPSSQVEITWRTTPAVEQPLDPATESPPIAATSVSGGGARDWLETPLPQRRESTPHGATAGGPRDGGSASTPTWDSWAHRGPTTPSSAQEPGSDDEYDGTSSPDQEGRVHPGLPPALKGGWSPGDAARPGGSRQLAGRSLILVGALVLLAIGLLGWRLTGRGGDVDLLRTELAAQQTAVAVVRANANATSFTMVPTESGPPAANGTVFFALPTLRGALVLRDMPGLPSGQAYQLWFVGSDGVVSPGPTARPDARGVVVMALDATGLQVGQLYLTSAPQEGTLKADFYTYPVLLVGILGGATG